MSADGRDLAGGRRRAFPFVRLAAPLGLALLVWLVLREKRDGAAGADLEAPLVTAPAAERGPAVGFADEARCVACHREQVVAWVHSDHAFAMQPANEETVLGDFTDASFEHEGLTTRFFRRDGRFVVETDGPNGEPAEFEAPYVFGVDPLQQLLLPLPGGRLQALAIAWDRKARRWFHLYPGERIVAGDPLHWTARALNWNAQCALCHATDLRRNHDPETDTYRTSWNRLDVGCQACHGPAARHLDWAERAASEPGLYGESERGFDAPLSAADSRVEVEACARCHARRADLGDGFDHRNRLMDDFLPALLDEGLYFADGQIQDEVYEYGSFLQSKMHAKGVRCSDCHEPHSLAQRLEGNSMCTSCHAPSPAPRPHVDASGLVRKAYDTPSHHFHEPGQPGSRCVDCHMPARTYMIVDPRRDHSFRVPRPDLAPALGAPDACTGCHAEKDAAWAAETIAGWTGPRKLAPLFGEALALAREGRPGAGEALLGLAGDGTYPAIARATALSLLHRYPGRKAFEALERGLEDEDPLVRHAAIGGIECLLPLQESAPLLAPLAGDPVRAVRMQAARVLAASAGPAPGASGTDGEALQAALAEYEAAQRALGDRPEAHLNLAGLHEELGRPGEAEAELRTALGMDPLFTPAAVNLAELQRRTGREAEAETTLREALGRSPEDAALHHALGLSLVRQGRGPEGLTALELAARLAPDDARLGYVYAVALHDSGRRDEARGELERVLERDPGDRDARLALAAYRREAGDAAGAERCLSELAEINPYDPALEEAFAPLRRER